MTDDERKFWSPTIPSDDTPIWRYRDLAQFLSILEKESLWFNRADLFSDSFEGSYSKANVETRQFRYEQSQIPERVIETISTTAKKFRKTTYLNCWHANTHESAAMWDLYLPADKGIAIKSTVGRFREAINKEDNNAKIEEDTDDEKMGEFDKILKIGNVNYIDYSSQLIPENNTYAPVYHKRKSYEHEREFRAAFSKFGDMLELQGGLRPEADFATAPGQSVDIDVNKLIKSVYVAPSAPDWFFDVLESVTDRYEIEINPQKSDLDEDPVF
ncbi:DUF2971 domain-containing protein [Haloarcula hispanica]|uniref:DUF2971 domain-containing protein n=1 Tax=Haloarcula hispanica TaxID=51589 RepID=UPI0021BD36B6|nr:DUF2971 domain-containing protein [Haloarcula hispanica]